MKRRNAATDRPRKLKADGSADAASEQASALPSSPLSQRLARPQSREEAEHRYVVARDAWTAAMRAANSGRPADLASLAIAQEGYEAAAAERERWMHAGRVAIPIEPDVARSAVEIAADQEIEWRKVRDHESTPGVRARVRRRLLGR